MLVYKNKTLVGFFEGDGGFSFRTIFKQNNKIFISAEAYFTQKTENKDVLEPILRTVEYNTHIRSYKSPEGLFASRVTLNFNKPWGQKFFKILQKFPPQGPRKFKDYLICCEILDLQKKNTYPNYTESQKLFAASILARSTSYQTSPNGVKKKITLCDILKQLDPNNTLGVKKQGLALFRVLRKKMLSKINDRKKILLKKKLPEAYFIGFFIADGSMGISFGFSKQDTALCIRTLFTLSDMDEDLLKAFNRCFLNGTGQIVKDKNLFILRTESQETAQELIIPLFSKFPLPSARTKQFLAFSRTANLAKRGYIFMRPSLLEMIKISWEMCEEGKNRQSTLQETLKKAENYSQHRLTLRIKRPQYLVELRKKYNITDRTKWLAELVEFRKNHKTTSPEWVKKINDLRKTKIEKPGISNIAWLSKVLIN